MAAEAREWVRLAMKVPRNGLLELQWLEPLLWLWFRHSASLAWIALAGLSATSWQRQERQTAKHQLPPHFCREPCSNSNWER